MYVDRYRHNCGDPLVLAKHSARAILSTHPVTTSNSEDQADGRKKETIYEDASVVVSIHRLRIVTDHGGGVDLLHHRLWHRAVSSRPSFSFSPWR